MNNDSQQTMTPSSTDSTAVQPDPMPAAPMTTGADVAAEAAGIAERDLTSVVPTMPAESTSSATSTDTETSMPSAPAAEAWTPASPAPDATTDLAMPEAAPEQPAEPAAPVDTPPTV